MYTLYHSPPGLDWDARRKEDNFEDDPKLETFNADKKSDDLLKFLDAMYPNYQKGHILVPMGGDFYYSNAFENFFSTDKLIDYFNKKYGTKYQL